MEDSSGGRPPRAWEFSRRRLLEIKRSCPWGAPHARGADTEEEPTLQADNLHL